MDRITKLKADLAALALEAKPLALKSKDEGLTEAESTSFDDIVGRLQKCQAEIETAVKQADAAALIERTDAQYNRPADSVKRDVVHQGDAGKAAGQPAQKSPGEALVTSDAYKRALSSGSLSTKGEPVLTPGFFGPEAQKALVGSFTAPGSALLAQVIPGVYRGLDRPLVLRDVLMNLSTSSDSITVMQENVYTNAAAEVAEATSVTTGLKPESGLTFTEATFPVQTIAHWMPVTRQLMEDLPFMAGYINERLLTGLRRREDAAFLNGSGAAPVLRGILQTSGIQVLDSTPTTGYFAVNPVKSAGTDNENINRIRRAIRVIQVTGQAYPTFILMNPVDAEKIDTSTDVNRQYIFGGATAPLPRTMWGLPIVESDNIAAGTALVGDGQMAAVVDRNQGRIYTTDSHSDFFVRNLLAVLAEERVALPVFRPAAFASVGLIA